MEPLHQERWGQFFYLAEKYLETSTQKEEEPRDEQFDEALHSGVKSSENHPWKEQIKQGPERIKLKIDLYDQRLPQRNTGSNKPRQR